MTAFLAFLAGICFFVSGFIYNLLAVDGQPLYFIPGIFFCALSGFWFGVAYDEL